MLSARTGYQPRTTPAERRAFFEVQRLINIAIADLRDEVAQTRSLTAYWQYSNTTTPPPGGGQLRSPSPTIDHFYLHKTDTDGYNRSLQLSFLPKGSLIRVRGATGSVFAVRTTGPTVDNTTWFDIPITVISGTDGDKGFRVELTLLTGIWAE